MASGGVFQEEWHLRHPHVAMTNAQLLQRTWYSQASVWQRARYRVSLVVKILLTIYGFFLCLLPAPHCPANTLWEEV